MKKQAQVITKRNHPKESNERLIRKFLKKVKKERIVEECRDRKHYNKPSVKKRIKKERAERTRLREQAKKLKAQQRRARKN
jgi:ribosomal protein S21|tara:strand:- start:336 stop:578 length:243 start_codon:yes stop_codon:yes gene_type:complete